MHAIDKEKLPLIFRWRANRGDLVDKIMSKETGKSYNAANTCWIREQSSIAKFSDE
jgi:hypothetical protein